MKRAYSLLTLKSIDEEARIITGIASTPETDRMGDIVEPKGAKFELPLPFLWQHNAEQPLGHVTEAKVTAAGIEIVAQIAKGVLPMIDDAWALIKAGLVRGLSIGFLGIESEPVDPKNPYWGGTKYLSWDWLELSAVTIPANADASIQTIKSADQPLLRAASGARQGRAVVRLATTPGATGSTTKPKGNTVKTLREHIAALEAKRAANVARMAEVTQKSIDEGRSMDESEGQEHDGLAAEIKSIDTDLVRLKAQEALAVASATPIVDKPGDGAAAAGTQQRQGIIVMGKNNLPKGTAFARYAMALASSRGNLMQAAEMAKAWKDTTPEVELSLKAAVAAGTTADSTWAAPLVVYQNMASEFIELLRPETIVGKMNLRRVPFNISMARTTAGTTSQWVGEGLPKPVSAMSFETINLGHTKIATIVVLTEETVRFSNPAAEALVSADMRAGIVQYSDAQFIDPTVTASGTTRPASITNGAQSYSMSGTTIAAVTTDIAKLFAYFSTNNLSLSSAVFVMHPRTALYLSMLRTTQDVFAFPGINMMGGTFFGVPVITSNSVPIDTGADSYIFLVDQSNILLADDGGVTLDISREASLQMDSAPSSSASSVISLWQSNMVGLRAERYINYRKRRDAAVVYLEDVSY